MISMGTYLILAGTNNLRQHAVNQDFMDFACAINDAQAEFLQRLLDDRAKSNAELEAGE
jgi:hypothetical protein